ncbi:hypothetical protein [Xanthobacter tagetidis]|jgi:hypothetical protein|uniref:Uncharacterized protein n=1 Tax=Xanthobacter tagetidis TaxID=60216 RepID=A0A3L7AMM9_9HYPH|nr:hypothetical protein [Xanthobacter tagetidis]MBB6308079.1 hypothetical protein [Xanthobacter tagetidis]RLP81709.1 hypothetical protein D9R14_01555 [Xanthobacter tagetidis]
MDAQTTEAKILVHARFAPDATVVEIGERPSGLTPQEWFFYLRENSDPSYFQPLSGGRGVFRIPRAEFDALKAAAAGAAA